MTFFDRLVTMFGYGATMIGLVMLVIGGMAIVTAIVGAVIYYCEYNDELEDEEYERVVPGGRGDRD